MFGWFLRPSTKSAIGRLTVGVLPFRLRPRPARASASRVADRMHRVHQIAQRHGFVRPRVHVTRRLGMRHQRHAVAHSVGLVRLGNRHVRPHPLRRPREIDRLHPWPARRPAHAPGSPRYPVHEGAAAGAVPYAPAAQGWVLGRSQGSPVAPMKLSVPDEAWPAVPLNRMTCVDHPLESTICAK